MTDTFEVGDLVRTSQSWSWGNAEYVYGDYVGVIVRVDKGQSWLNGGTVCLYDVVLGGDVREVRFYADEMELIAKGEKNDS